MPLPYTHSRPYQQVSIFIWFPYQARYYRNLHHRLDLDFWLSLKIIKTAHSNKSPFSLGLGILQNHLVIGTFIVAYDVSVLCMLLVILMGQICSCDVYGKAYELVKKKLEKD